MSSPVVETQINQSNRAVPPAGHLAYAVSSHPDIDRDPPVRLAELDLSRVAPVASGLLQQFKMLLERPWAPDPRDLPPPGKPENFGNSQQAFRQPAKDLASQQSRKAQLNYVRSHQERSSISGWSSLYRYSVPVRNLPRALEDFRILHLSDIHFEFGKTGSINEINRLAEFLTQSRERIDLLLISGDIITRSIKDLQPPALDALERLVQICPRAFMVLGNHDYHGFSEKRLISELEKRGIFSLDNARIRMSLEGAVLGIYGVEDAIFGRPRAPQNVRAEEVNILLTHNLDALRVNFPDSFDLILSGHTHWGEVRFINGVRIMGAWGYADNLNKQSKKWAALSNRALSYVHPGLARYYIPFSVLRHPPGFVIHRLAAAKDSTSIQSKGQ